MNTLDLSVDHVFWELERNPWVVRNLLDNFVRHYSYVDGLKAGGAAGPRPGGLSFTHDMGAHNNFSPHGHSSYELPELDAVCFSYMTAEQLCNWTLIAATSWSRAATWTGRGRTATSCLPACRACGTASSQSGVPSTTARAAAVRRRNHDLRLARPLAGADAK